MTIPGTSPSVPSPPGDPFKHSRGAATPPEALRSAELPAATRPRPRSAGLASPPGGQRPPPGPERPRAGEAARAPALRHRGEAAGPGGGEARPGPGLRAGKASGPQVEAGPAEEALPALFGAASEPAPRVISPVRLL